MQPAAPGVSDGGASTLSGGALGDVAAAPPAPRPVLPTATPRPWHVGLQAGHWQIADLPDSLSRLRDQSGTTYHGYREVDLNLDYARRAAAILQAAGVVVDVLPATVPNGYQADAFVAIHVDGNIVRPDRGFKDSPPYRSAVAWQDAVLNDALSNAYATATGLPRDPGISDNMRGYYAINGWMGGDSRISITTPSSVIETGFLTSAADRAVLLNAPDQIAAGIAQGMLAYLGEKAAAEAHQAAAAAAAAASPTGCSLVVTMDQVPVRAADDPSAAEVAAVNRGAILPYLGSTAIPQGPFTEAQGRRLVVDTGYYLVAPPGGGAPAYVNHGPSIVQIPPP